MKLPVIARQISHLTDARYFAALEVDYISYDLGSSEDAIDEVTYSDIAEWVEGPKTLIENPPHRNFNSEVGYIFGYPMQAENESTFIVMTISQLKENFMDKHPKGNYIILLDEKEYPGAALLTALSKYEGRAQFYFQSDVYLTPFIQFLLEDYPTMGIVFCGSKEEKTGMKSYEALDEVIELLEEY